MLNPGAESGALRRAADSVEALQKEVEKQWRRGARADEQIRVVVEQDPAGGFAGVVETLRAALGPLEILLLTLVYAAVLLARQYDLLDRVVRIAGVENMSGSTAALSEAGARLSRFFVAQGILNLAFGALTAHALLALGIPNAILWGMAAAVLRFIPFIGIFVAALPALLLAAAAAPGWSLLLGVLAFYVMAELIFSNVIEPLTMGKHIGLSPLAFIAAGSFWWVVWGPIGLLLAAPITTTLVVLGDYFPSLQFITLLFGDKPPLTPEQEYYHRLLAGDAATAAEPLEKAVETRGLADVCDRVVLPALEIAAQDLRAGRVNAERMAQLAQTLAEVQEIAFFSRRDDEGEAPGATPVGDVALLAGHGPVDAAAAEFLAHALTVDTGRICAAVRHSTGLMALSSLQAEKTSNVETLILLTVGGVRGAQLAHLTRRAKMAFPEARVIVYARSAEERKPASDGEAAHCSSVAQMEQLLSYPFHGEEPAGPKNLPALGA